MCETLENLTGTYFELNGKAEIRSPEILNSSGCLAEMHLNTALLIKIAEFWNELIYQTYYMGKNPEKYYAEVKAFVDSKFTPPSNTGIPIHVAFFYDPNREQIVFSILTMISSTPLLLQTMKWLLEDELCIV